VIASLIALTAIGFVQAEGDDRITPPDRASSRTLSARSDAATSPVAAGNASTSATAAGEDTEREPHWKRLEIAKSPAARFGTRAVFDAERKRVVLFGGFLGSNQRSHETWEFDGTSWTQLRIPGPPAFPGYAMAYDGNRGVVVLFGGFRGETWEFDGAQWERVKTNHRPPITGFGEMTFDPDQRVIVLFGGEMVPARPDALPTLSDQTWHYDGYDWVEVDAQGPSPRKYHRIVYDAARRKIVLFGGFDGRLVNDTWELDPYGWRPVQAPVAPSARRDFALVYDSAGRRTLLYGGHPGGDELWAYDGAAWTRIKPAGALPAFREGAAFVYMSTNRRVLVFGGLSNTVLNDSWEFIRGADEPIDDEIPPVLIPTAASLFDRGTSPMAHIVVPPPLAPPPFTGIETILDDLLSPPASAETSATVRRTRFADLRQLLPPIAADTSASPRPTPRRQAAAPVPALTPSAHPPLAELNIDHARVFPRTITSSTLLTFTGRIRNTGRADAVVWIEFWVSDTRDPFAPKAFLCDSAAAPIKANESYDLSTLFRRPYPNIPPGQAYIGVLLDRPGQVPEQDETNNLSVIPTPFTFK
jgi:hypothetical protein